MQPILVCWFKVANNIGRGCSLKVKVITRVEILERMYTSCSEPPDWVQNTKSPFSFLSVWLSCLSVSRSIYPSISLNPRS